MQKNLLSFNNDIFSSVHFVNQNTGYITASTSLNHITIYKTTNSGLIWTELLKGTRPLNDMTILNEVQGYVVGYAGKILKTTDAGAWWIEQDFTKEDLSSVYFTDENNGWTVGNSGTVLKTVDAGNTWNLNGPHSYSNWYDVSFINNNKGWIVGESGKIFVTTNAGTNWFEQSINTSQDLLSIRSKNIQTRPLFWIL